MKILVIEDEEDIREVLRQMLEINGHTVLAAASGEEGLELAAKQPDLILCDIGLPGMDGYQVITAIRQRRDGADLPFIFLTARATRDDQRLGMKLGADDYVTKPFTEREIMDAIEARIRRHLPLRERIEQLLQERSREMSAEWSHELLTPLTAVMGGLDLIEADGGSVSPAELKGLLGLIRSGAERQQRLSHKLIRFFELERIRSGPRQQPAWECAADGPIALASARIAEQEDRKDDLRLQVEPGRVALSADVLGNAVAELVENALRFSPKGSPVDVSGRRVGGAYRIEVSDCGEGMTAEQMKTVGPFTQFGRQHREQQGLGIGLAIARAVAEIGGGRLDLMAGRGGRGLTVALDLPCV